MSDLLFICRLNADVQDKKYIILEIMILEKPDVVEAMVVSMWGK